MFASTASLVSTAPSSIALFTLSLALGGPSVVGGLARGLPGPGLLTPVPRRNLFLLRRLSVWLDAHPPGAPGRVVEWSMGPVRGLQGFWVANDGCCPWVVWFPSFLVWFPLFPLVWFLGRLLPAFPLTTCHYP